MGEASSQEEPASHPATSAAAAPLARAPIAAPKPLPNPVRAYLASLSPNGRSTMEKSLRRVTRVMRLPGAATDLELYQRVAWWQLTPSQTLEIRRLLLEEHDDYGVATVKLTLCALRGVLHQCFRLGYIDGDTYLRVKSWPKVTGGDPILAGRMLEPAELARLREAYGRLGPFEAAMDGAILEVGLATGARLHELAGMQLEDLSADARQIRILGKLRKVRHMTIPPFAGGVLEAWLATRARYPFSVQSIFVRVAGGKAIDAATNPRILWGRLRWLGRAARVTFTPHDLRRTFISTGLSVTDLATVQQLAGHSDPRTTSRYDRRPDATRQGASMLIGKSLEPPKT